MIPAPWLLAATIAGRVDAAGVHHLVSAQRGRPVVVSFWATWCAPCVQELPEIAAFAREHKDVALISVSIDDLSDEPAVAAIIDKLKPPFGVYLKAAGPDQAFIDGVDPKWSGSVPATLVFDATGRKRRLIEGEQTRAQIEQALAGRPSK